MTASPSPQILQGIQLDTQYFASGGFADIFMGQWIQQSGEILRVAVKFIRRTNPNDLERNRKRFSREARLWALLGHHNLVPFYGLHFNQEIPGLVMPYYANGDLVNYLQRQPQVDKLSLIRGIAAGLEYMHGFIPNPAVHGDIKASNIMVTDTGEACLADFGLAKILCTPGYTTPNACGSSRWTSPEILRGDELPTTSSDIWAFAMTILEIYTGKIPFNKFQNDAVVIWKICNGSLPTHPHEINSTIWALLWRCWEADPRKRPRASTVVIVLRIIALQSLTPEGLIEIMDSVDSERRS